MLFPGTVHLPVVACAEVRALYHAARSLRTQALLGIFLTNPVGFGPGGSTAARGVLYELTVLGDAETPVDADVHMLRHGRTSSFPPARRPDDRLNTTILRRYTKRRIGARSHPSG